MSEVKKARCALFRALLFGVPALAVGLMQAESASAQLMACDQIDGGGAVTLPPGSCIARSLEDQIDLGHTDTIVGTPGSGNIQTGSLYLIKHDPARSVRRGRQLFQRKFSFDEGNGPRVNNSSTGDITHSRALGAGLVDSCAGCHGRPRGTAGFGGVVQTFPDSRDSPHLFGLGLMEQLADEMTAELREERDEAIEDVLEGHEYCPLTEELEAKGVEFGEITVACDGTVDYSEVEGVDAPSLRVRPFFAEGRTRSIREFIFGALNDEMGIQIHDPILCAVTDPANPVAKTSPAGFQYDPTTDEFERPPGCGGPSEVDVAVVDHLEFYLLNYFKPGRYQQTTRTAAGLQLMKSIGCTQCHVQNLTINADRRVADVETGFDPVKGIFNELFAVASTRFTVVSDPSSPFPFVLPARQPFVVQNIFTDFKRHDLGPDFDERDYDGNVIREHITEALWGVGSTAPYGHDGRSINLDAVIRRHGGEAANVTLAYANLSSDNRNKILEFLSTLILFPPDDTASTLNPGNPNGNPQDPANHGSVNLGALFQISSSDIGPE